MTKGLTASWLGATAFGALAWGSTEARADVLYDQVLALSGDAASQDFELMYDSADCQGADDFTVPAGSSWSVETVVADGYYASGIPVSGPMATLHVRIY
jgi:hypothetical protein